MPRFTVLDAAINNEGVLKDCLRCWCCAVLQVLLDSVSVSTVIGSSLGRSYDLKQRANALSVCRAWAAKGYQVIYLSGRQGSAYNMTAQWLIRHGYPPGPIHLTRTHLPTLPLYVSVGHFKVGCYELHHFNSSTLSRVCELFLWVCLWSCAAGC